MSIIFYWKLFHPLFNGLSTVLNHRHQNRFDLFPTRYVRHFESSNPTGLKTRLTGLTVLPDWFAAKPLFFPYISAISPGWLGSTFTPLQHTPLLRGPDWESVSDLGNRSWPNSMKLGEDIDLDELLLDPFLFWWNMAIANSYPTRAHGILVNYKFNWKSHIVQAWLEALSWLVAQLFYFPFILFTRNQSLKFTKHSLWLKYYLGQGKKMILQWFLSQNKVYANEVILQKCRIIMMPGKQQILITQMSLSCFGLKSFSGNSWRVSWFLIRMQVKIMIS